MRFTSTQFLTLAILLGAGRVGSSRASAETVSVSVQATSNIFASGLADTNAVGGGDLPVKILLPSGTGRTVSFLSVTGGVSPDPPGLLFPGPFFGGDGIPNPTKSPNLDPAGLVSGIRADSGFFLAGVLEGSSTVAVPPTLNFSGHQSFSSLSPLLQQTFFIGDGLTGTGSGNLQIFNVPDGATALYLGFPDGGFFQGKPGAYSDNRGQLDVSMSFSVNPIPEPSSFVMLCMALVGLSGIYTRRRSRAL